MMNKTIMIVICKERYLRSGKSSNASSKIAFRSHILLLSNGSCMKSIFWVDWNSVTSLYKRWATSRFDEAHVSWWWVYLIISSMYICCFEMERVMIVMAETNVSGDRRCHACRSFYMSRGLMNLIFFLDWRMELLIAYLASTHPQTKKKSPYAKSPPKSEN